MSRTPALPIDALLPAVLASLARTPNLVLEAAPGAGKTTRVPPALLSLVAGEVLVLEPRRIAARLAARRVAFERDEPLGETVGYQVRFEEKVSPRTRLRFVTEGILTRRLLSDPTLRGVDAIVLDEFHERHVDTDLALALLKRLQQKRPDLRLLVMSATLDSGPVSRFLGDCPVLRSEGRLFPLRIAHAPYSPDPLPLQIRRAAEQLADTHRSGSILAFLPGLAEIRRTQRECDSLTARFGLRVLPLHGDLPPAEQDLAVNPSPERKLILATNVAESSITVEGVNAVIDSGLVRQATFSPWNGLPTLRITRISKASATQRAGRAGRTGAGEVIRLYPEQDFALRPDHDAPEITRTDLAQLLLHLRAMGIAHPDELDWLTPPLPEAVTAAEALLDRLNANAADAQRLAALPAPPRLARVLLSAIDRNVAADAARAVAFLGLNARSEHVDLLASLDHAHDQHLQQHTQQLLRAARIPATAAKAAQDSDEALLLSLLTGFPDRVGRKRAGKQALLSNGIAAEFATEPPYNFFLALDAEDRPDQALPLIRTTARVEPEWLLDLFPNQVVDRTEIIWNRTAERVEKVSTLLYDQLVLEESRMPAPAAEAAPVLAREAIAAGIERFVDPEALSLFLHRVAFAGIKRPDLDAALTRFATTLGLVSFAALREAAPNFLPSLASEIDSRTLNERAPTTLRLPSGRNATLHYEADKSPWVESRLQDFFGLTETPRIGADRTPIVIHLLAPNHRAVQTTTDLAGFWQRLYPQVRKELMRRYPRHSWPEDPLTAEPTGRPLPRK